MNSENLKRLFKGYFEGTLTAEEHVHVQSILSNDPSMETRRIFDTCYLLYAHPQEFKSAQKDRIWKNIRKSAPFARRMYSWPMIVKYAAVFLFFGFNVFLISYWLLKSQWQDQNDGVQSQISLIPHQFPNIYVYDKNLSGQQLMYDELATYGLEYTGDSALRIREDFDFPDHTLVVSTIPGQMQKVVAPDGTEIWLNSKSEVHIPRVYGRHVAEVRLAGEAFFDVAHQWGTPFVVYAQSEKTEVLGTQFNIRSYPKEPVYTTLVEGSVRVSNDKMEQVLLTPGEQAFSDPGLMKRRVPVENFISWKNGDFYFDNLSLKELLDEVEEWYNISFVRYEHESSDRISGIFKRSHSLDELLRNIEELSTVKFKIKEGGVYVMKK